MFITYGKGLLNMTIGVACRLVNKDGSAKVVIASDSEITDEEYKHYVKGSPKIYQVNDCFMAISGMGPLGEALSVIQNDKEYLQELKIKDRENVREFAEVLFTTFKELVEVGLQNSDIAEYVGLLILATPTNIYSIWNDLTVTEHDHYVTIGSGRANARGALEVLHEQLRGRTDLDLISEEGQWGALEAIARKAVKIASDQCIGCGGDIDLRRVPKVELPVAKKVRKVRKTIPVKKRVKR